MPIKRQALDLVEHLPENASWDDLMYEVYVRQKIEAGLAAANQGRTVSHEEVKRRFAIR